MLAVVGMPLATVAGSSILAAGFGNQQQRETAQLARNMAREAMEKGISPDRMLTGQENAVEMRQGSQGKAEPEQDMAMYRDSVTPEEYQRLQGQMRRPAQDQAQGFAYEVMRQRELATHAPRGIKQS